MIEYRIYKEVYDEIILKKKTVEFRLLNAKAKKIKKGDIIRFQVLNGQEYCLVEVLDKYIYKNIEELWNHKEVLNNILNYSKNEFEEVLYKIFGKEKVLQHNIVGIKFKIVD